MRLMGLPEPLSSTFTLQPPKAALTRTGDHMSQRHFLALGPAKVGHALTVTFQV